VGIKDEFDVAGWPTAMRGPDAPRATEDAACVALLRRAGAIVVGKTAMPIGGTPPPTRNPWHTDHTPGGSSSGSGAAVAARMVPLAIAEQTAGSTLRPAAFCGVAGLKPTYGLISRFGCAPFTWSRDHVGLIGLKVEDLALALSVLAGRDPRDPTTLDVAPPAAELRVEDLAPPRIGLVQNLMPGQVEDVMVDAIGRSAGVLERAGAQIVPFALPDEFALARPIADLLDAERGALHANKPLRSGGLNREQISALVPAAYYVQAERIRTWLGSTMRAAVADFDALLMPAALGAAPRGVESTGDSNPLLPWSLLGFPALTINGGVTPTGLPLGIQLVAGPLADEKLLRVGAWCEARLGRLSEPPI
jgi:Asp-tRNA(Asn)/Glu-tRNA(Gln) amidotransferase A subunit family amidase